MSVVPIESETLTSVPCTSGGWLLAGGSHAHRRDGAGMDGSRQVERRRTGSPGDSPMDILLRLPAVVVLERIPVPSLAMARKGNILLTNTPFTEMVRSPRDELAGSASPEIFHTVPAEVAALSGVDALANLVVQLKHCEGWTVRARMSNSALMRHDDQVVLVTFEDLTDQLWMDEQ